MSPTKYAIRVAGTMTATTVTRTTGWHEFKWDYTSGTHVDMYVDGVLVTPAGGLAGVTSFNTMSLGDWWNTTASGTTYFDDVTVK